MRLIDKRLRAGTVPAMITTEQPELPQMTSFNFDEARHWAWADAARNVLTSSSDQNLFDMCAFGTTVFPLVLLEYMTETACYTPEQIVNQEQWKRATDIVRRRAFEGDAEDFADFCDDLHAYLATFTGQHSDELYVDIVDATTRGCLTTPSFSFADINLWSSLPDTMTSLKFEHVGGSPVARLTAESAGATTVLELHFPADAVRDKLARHHFETVLDGDEAIVAHLNAVSDERCSALTKLAANHANLDVRELDAILEVDEPEVGDPPDGSGRAIAT